MKITDWEIYQTYRNIKRYYKNEKLALEKLKEKWLGFFNNERRESYFILGTVHPWPKFIIIGVFSFIKKDECKMEQLTLF